MKNPAITVLIASVVAITAYASTRAPKEDELKDVGRIAAFAVHAKMIKEGKIERALDSLEGLMKHGYESLRKSGADEGSIAAARRAILEYYVDTNQQVPDYLK